MSLPVVGQTFSHYRVVSMIGGGGMGEVYEAEDIRLGRHVAVKFLPETLAGSQEALDRFSREARAASALNHPHICTVFDIGEEQGRPFIVMELMKGQTLKEHIGGKAMPLERVLTLGAQIADALGAAHQQGITHRDIKPANIFITEHGEAKLLDFGLAKLATGGAGRGASDDDRTLPRGDDVTVPGTTMGTVSYMSPEQARGGSAGPHGDLFSLGVVLYEMATGALPFRGHSATEIIDAILHQEPVPPVRLNPDVPAEFERVVAKALEKDSALRYQSATDIRTDLKRLQRATGPVPLAAAEPPWRRHRRAMVHGTVAAAVLIVAAGLWFWRSSRGPAPADAGPVRIAVLPFENLGTPEDGYFADGITDEVRNKIASLPQLAVIARSSVVGYKGSGKSPEAIAKELNARYLLSGTVRWQKATSGGSRIRVVPELLEMARDGPPTQRWQDSFDAVVEDVFRVQTEIATRVAAAMKVSLGVEEQRRLSGQPTTNIAAYEAYLRGEAQAGNASTALQRAIAQYEQAVALDPSFAAAWARLSSARTYLYYNSVALTPGLGQSAREAANRALELAPGLPVGRLARGQYYALIEKNPARALEDCRPDPGAPADPSLLECMAQAETTLGQFDAALGHLEQALVLAPRSATTAGRVAVMRLWTRRYRDAIAAADAAIRLDPSNAAAVETRAMGFLGLGDLDEARRAIAGRPPAVEASELVMNFGLYWDLMWVLDEPLQRLLLSLPVEAFGGDASSRALVYAQTHALKGNTTEVRRYAEEAQRGFEIQSAQNLGNEQMVVAHGLALAYLGRREDAIRVGQHALELAPVSRDAYGGRYAQHQMVRIYMILGEREKALDLLEPLMKGQYYLSPAWLAIDPNFVPLKGHPRFEKLLAAK